MGSELFSLCWNNFHTNLSTGFHSLFQGEHLVDVTLAAEGRILKAHKMVLSVCSPYFNELFRENPCKHPIVFLKDVSASALDQLLTFMYRGEVSVRQDELNSFIKTGEALQIKGLTGHNTTNNHSASNTVSPKESPLNGVSHLYNNSNMDTVQNLSRDNQYNTPKKRQRSQLLTTSTNPLTNLNKLKHIASETVPALLQPAVFTLNNPSTSRLIQTSIVSNINVNDENLMEMPAKRSCSSSLTSSDKEDHPSLPIESPFIQSIKPKQEPLDEMDEYNNETSQFSDGTMMDDSMDATALLETKVSIGGDLHIEQSSSSSSANTGWAPIKLKQLHMGEMPAPGISGTQPLRFMTSGRGLPVLVYAGHMYTLDERKNNKAIWVCVKRRKLNCQGCVTTTSPPSSTTTLPGALSIEATSPGSGASSTASTSSGKGKGKKDSDAKDTLAGFDGVVAPKIISYCGHNHSHLNDIIERIQPKDCISVTPKTE